MTLYEWVYNDGEIAEGLFCTEQCAEDTYFDDIRTAHGAPSPLDERESEELAAEYVTCFGCGKTLLKGEPEMNFEAAKRGVLMDAVSALRKICPKTAYVVSNNCIERMKVDRIELNLDSGNVVFVDKNVGKPGVNECKKQLIAVLLDEEEAIRRWHEKGLK